MMARFTCTACGIRFTSLKTKEQHYGKQRCCLDPEMVPTLQMTGNGAWGHLWLDYEAWKQWQTERYGLTRMTTVDFSAWESELIQK